MAHLEKLNNMNQYQLNLLLETSLAGQERVYEHAIKMHSLRIGNTITREQVTGWSVHDYRTPERPQIERLYVTVTFDNNYSESFQFIEAFTDKLKTEDNGE